MKPILLEKHRVPEGTSTVRCKEYIPGILHRIISKKSLRKKMDKGEIFLNGEVLKHFNLVQSGDLIELYGNPQHFKTFDLPLTVLYEDQHILAVEKPPGIPVNGNSHKTLEHALPYNSLLSDEYDSLSYPMPLHRLDVPTGGIVLTAKTLRCQQILGLDFEHRKIKKRYRAVVVGEPQQEIITEPIDSREAVTRCEILETKKSLTYGKVSLVDLFPESGRKHQLRKHMAFIGCPIIGDTLHNDEKQIFKGKGLFLWAVEITFSHPVTSMEMRIEVKTPDKFFTYLNREDSRWKKFNL